MELETRYPQPDADTIDALVAACVGSTTGDVEVVGTGSSALVILTAEAAIRVARDEAAAEEMLRSQQLVEHLPDLPFDVPRSLGAPVSLSGFVAVPTTRLRGEPHPAGSGDPAVLRELLEAIHSIDTAALAPWLAKPHAFSGGPEWLEVLSGQVVPLLPKDQQDLARRVIDDVSELDGYEPTLNHGDLAGANVLWDHERVVGVLDWDLAARCDPADDVASLASWHGWDLVDDLADAATVRRAEMIRRTFGMQVVAFTLLHGRDESALSRAIQRASARLR